MPKYKIEFIYDNRKDKTNIYIWLGTRIVDTRELNGQISNEQEKKVKISIQLELIEENK